MMQSLVVPCFKALYFNSVSNANTPALRQIFVLHELTLDLWEKQGHHKDGVMLPFNWNGSFDLELPYKSDGEILLAILRALRAEKAQNIRYTDNQVKFNGGFFRWVSKSNRLNMISSGTITFQRNNERMVRVQYYLSFWELFLLITVWVGGIFRLVVWDYSSTNPHTKLFIVVGMWFFLYGSNFALALFGFSRLLKQSLTSSNSRTTGKRH